MVLHCSCFILLEKAKRIFFPFCCCWCYFWIFLRSSKIPLSSYKHSRRRVKCCGLQRENKLFLYYFTKQSLCLQLLWASLERISALPATRFADSESTWHLKSVIQLGLQERLQLRTLEKGLEQICFHSCSKHWSDCNVLSIRVSQWDTELYIWCAFRDLYLTAKETMWY